MYQVLDLVWFDQIQITDVSELNQSRSICDWTILSLIHT